MKHAAHDTPFGLFAQPRAPQIESAAAHAERDVPGWNARALAFLLEFAQTHAEFTGEQVVAASAGVVPDAPTPKAWGGVIQGAAYRREIVNTGKSAKRVTGNLAPLWRKA